MSNFEKSNDFVANPRTFFFLHDVGENDPLKNGHVGLHKSSNYDRFFFFHFFVSQ